MSISVSHSEIYGIPGKRLILNIQVEHPHETWKEIKIFIKYHPIFKTNSFEHLINRTNDVGFTVLKTEVVLPQDLGEYKLGEIIIERNGTVISHDLPRVHILTLDGYFEEMVAKELRSLGFVSKRWGGPDNPDIEAYHPDFPTQKFQVEATIEQNYGLRKYREDTGKFHDLKNRFDFKRLLIVPLVDPTNISKDVFDRLRKTSDPISLICFGDLQKLSEKYKNYHISKYEVFAYLSQTGFIRI